MVSAEEQRCEFTLIVLEQNLDLNDVWLRYFAMTGQALGDDVFLYAMGMLMLSEVDRDLLLLAARDAAQEADSSFRLKTSQPVRDSRLC